MVKAAEKKKRRREERRSLHRQLYQHSQCKLSDSIHLRFIAVDYVRKPNEVMAFQRQTPVFSFPLKKRWTHACLSLSFREVLELLSEDALMG